MVFFIVFTSLVFLLLGFIWKRSDWLNVFIKFLFYFMAGWGGVLIAHSFGYIVKT